MNAGTVRFLSLHNVLQIHEDTLAHEGGSPGVRDGALLAAAVEMPQSTWSGNYLHTDLAEMAAAYLYHICQNHAFMDGNKRTAAFSAVLFLDINDVPEGELPDGAELEDVTRRVASGRMSKAEVTEFFRSKLISPHLPV